MSRAIAPQDDSAGDQKKEDDEPARRRGEKIHAPVWRISALGAIGFPPRASMLKAGPSVSIKVKDAA
jgi:hypothetical protein